ncbi:CLIP-associated -like isoform A [Micractinium conductrix]|uniref:CLIP-associated-like isoform A n=1 Tax=Micractinium conductrix TaxID=554055 RepID=A0A2P6VC76_9CHLO|nr:CLIP-associated -like isoform B [Micractinium conductrix]PSC71696.1 CLIP-associated -like isoform A [Micractinium conductrix]|eukprot:PSC71695.1 CLIP-associated -like isoform B [Micractinium conductrix]
MAGRQRRAGFGDAAGVGALPEAAPFVVGSQAELRAELERVAAQLSPSTEWTLRVDALLRLEGLVKGGAAELPAFADLVSMLLRDALATQLQERRSAVSRQACHAVGMLAAACGHAFEPLAMHLLPLLFKTLAMGINVVSDCAESCAHEILAHCHSARLLPRLLAVVSGDRNGRLRQSAAEWLLAALQWWEPSEMERQLEPIERAVLAAAGDAQAETRATGRALFAAFSRAWPAAGAATLGRLANRDRQLADKLARAVAEGAGLDGTHASQPATRRNSLGNSGAATPRGLSRSSSLSSAPAGAATNGGPVRLAPVVPKLALSGVSRAAGSARGSPSHPASARAPPAPAQAPAWQPATARENQPSNRAAAGPAAVMATPRSMFPKTLARREAATATDGEAEAEAARPAAARERLAPRRSIGGAALRMSVAAFGREMGMLGALGEASEEPAGSQRTAHMLPRGVARAPLPSLPLAQLAAEPLPQQVQPQAAHLDPAAARPLTARRMGALERQVSGFPEDSTASSLSAGWEDGSAPPASLAPLLASLAKGGGGDWADRVAALQAVQGALQQAGSSQLLAADVASNADRLLAVLLENAGDAHFRVSAAALGALGAGLAGPCSRLFEPQLDRVMTSLFVRVVDPKEQIRQLAGAALAAALANQSADATVGATARALQASRAPKIKCAVMEWFAAAAAAPGGPSPAGGEAPSELAAPLLLQLTGSALPGLLRSLLQLATDRNPDIRKAAAEAVAAVYHGGDPQAVQAAVHALPPADVLAVQRSIVPAINQRGGSAGGDAAPPPSRAGGRVGSAGTQPAGSRRQSGEGLGQQQQCSNGSAAAGSRQDSHTSSPAASKQQTVAAVVAPPPAAPAQQQQQQQLTPEPPSPFIWRGPSATPPPDGLADLSEQALQPPEAAAEPLAAAFASGSAPAPLAQQQAAALPSAAAAPAAAAVVAQPRPAQQQQQQAALPCVPSAAAADLAPFDDVMAGQLARLLAQLEQGPSSDALQGLSRLAHVLPAAAWSPCFDQVAVSLCAALDSGSAVVREAGLMLARDLSAATQPSLFLPALSALLPRMLGCAAEHEAREVALAAHEALDTLLSRAPPQSCLGLLAPRLPPAGVPPSAAPQEGAALHAAIRGLRRVAARMQPAGLAAHLQPQLVPGLCAAFASPFADVRKATVDCLVAIWQVVGDVLRPHLEPLSASQLKLLTIYRDKARAAGAGAA